MDMFDDLTAEDAFYNLKYGIGIVVEVAVADWLLSRPHSTFGPDAVLAYFLLATSAFALLVGFFWYWAWFAQRGVSTVWYLAGVTELVGIGMFAAGWWFNIESLFGGGLGISILLPLLYGAWRLVRFLVIRLFGVLLIAISQIAAAWRGELPR